MYVWHVLLLSPYWTGTFSNQDGPRSAVPIFITLITSGTSTAVSPCNLSSNSRPEIEYEIEYLGSNTHELLSPLCLPVLSLFFASQGSSVSVAPTHWSEIIIGAVVSAKIGSDAWGVLIRYSNQFGCSNINRVASFRIARIRYSPRWLVDHRREEHQKPYKPPNELAMLE
ncbi:hypothetical protein EDD18DRAFT_1102556 [Armillaria luteobubalina]|uniref:Uncharacterized protein n=1 Tax=Armillaria luteobubalina TaxID=153913 RepID=A0AA39QDF1_9AGAR|nr:hypothetical protein EDD18DRAFT_1102556 [Armillaria luteobubalina]